MQRDEHRRADAAAWKAQAEHLVAEWAMSREWAEGVAALKLMGMPKGATEWRWQQIVADAEALACRWHSRLVDAGWSLADVFGFDPDDDDTSFGLVVAIRGGCPLVMDDGSVCVRGDGGRRWYRSGEAIPDVPMIWTINRRRAERHENPF